MSAPSIAVFASGNGSNFQAIAEAVKKGRLKGHLRLLVCDNPEAYVLERAKKFRVKTFLIDRCNYSSKKGFEDEIIRNLKAEKIDLIVLAGFMRILSPNFVNHYKNRIINIHPALLPSFKGAHAIKDAFDYGVRVTGVTVHFVDEKMDHGPIILQEALKVGDKDSLESLERKIHQLEHRIYPQALNLLLSGKLKIRGRKVFEITL
jgi:phosphoribosylglycinamide formyltransferase-1